jgi:hypothetical protein
VALGLAFSAKASLIDEGFYPGPANSGEATEAAYVGNELGIPGLQLLKKFNFDGIVWSGPSLGFYAVSWSGDAEPTTASIQWDLTGTFPPDKVFAVAVKSGHGDNSYHLYSVALDQQIVGGWDTVASFVDEDGKAKGISHISWFGNPTGGDTPVPEGGLTAVMLGAALAGFGLLRRRS